MTISIRTLVVALQLIVLQILNNASTSAQQRSASEVPQLKDFPELAEFQSFEKITVRPHPVPFAIWSLCRSPSMQERELNKAEHGPHSSRFISVFANSKAAQTLRAAGKSFAEGSIILKTKLGYEQSSAPVSIGAMVKRGSNFNLEGGNWEYFFFDVLNEDQEKERARKLKKEQSSKIAKQHSLGKFLEFAPPDPITPPTSPSFLYLRAKGVVQNCQECHSKRSATDYVFASYLD